jgi:uncharacterized protein YbjT (DUF2867 family)
MANTTAPQQQRPVLVVGATGKTGGRVADRLQRSGLPVRRASRTSTTDFDWTDRSTWRPALDGAGAVYITYQPDLIVPNAADDLAAFVATAGDAGIERLVLLSGRGEPEAQACEQIVLNSGIGATVLRCSWFAQNFSEAFLVDGIRGGEVVLPVGSVGEPFVDADDIADVAVLVLTGAGHDGRLYELTGPRLLSFADATAEVGEILGRDITFVTVPAADYRAAMLAEGMGTEYTDMVVALFGTLFDGRNESVTDGVREILGREPSDFNDVAKRAAMQGVW